MTTRRYGGIDPGVKGAVATIEVDADGNCRVVWCDPNPYHTKTAKIKRGKRKGKMRQAAGAINLAEMRAMIRYSGCASLDGCAAVGIEDLHARKSLGCARSQWRLGESCSTWKAGLTWLAPDTRIELLTPQAWHKLIVPGRRGKWGGETGAEKKRYSIVMCRTLYPDANLRRTPRSRTDDHNLAEAILIAHAAWLLDKEKGCA